MEETRDAPWGSVETRFDPIHSAARERNVKRVRALLEEGIDVNSLNGEAPNGDGGNTPLWFAAQGPWPDGLAAVRVLVEAGAEVNRQCEHGRTALHMASAWGHLDVVEYLLDQGADPTIRAEVDGTPEDMARARNRREICNFFNRLKT